MLEALPNLPALYASDAIGGTKKVYAIVRMAESAGGMEAWCIDANETSYRTMFTPDKLTPLKEKSGAKTWDEFFKGLEEAFRHRNVVFSATDSAVVMQVTLSSGSVDLAVAKTAEKSQFVKMLTYLIDSCKLREDDAFRKERVTKAEALATAAERDAANIARGVSDMHQTVENASQLESAARDRLAALQAELKSLSAVSSAPAASAKHPDVLSGLRVVSVQEAAKESPAMSRLPYRDANGNVVSCRKLLDRNPPHTTAGCLDRALLTLIKGKLAPNGGIKKDGDDSDPRRDEMANRVIVPLAPSALADFGKGLTEKGRGIVMTMMTQLDEWDFDMLNMQALTGGASLFTMSYALFQKHNIPRELGVEEDVLLNFLTQAEAGYHPNPYHNSTHAADVLHILTYILTKGGLARAGRLSKHDIMAAMVAALIHDYDHPGINNMFHNKTQTYLARLYSDRSVLENHHAAEVFEMLKDPRFDILAQLAPDYRRDVRDTIVDMVLSTDMGLHTKILSTFKRRFQDEKELADKAGRTDGLFKKRDDIRLALSMAIKMADISNCGRPQHLYLKWSFKIADEFFLQGDRERCVGMAVSPFMDRLQPSMAKAQVAFMNYIVVPLFEAVSDFLPDMHFSLDMVEKNKQYWATHDDSPQGQAK